MRSENIEILGQILGFAAGKRAEELCLSLCGDYQSLSALISADPENVGIRQEVSEGLAVLPKLLGCIASRRITDGFELGKRHTEDEICNYLSGVFLGSPVESVYMLTLDERERVLSADFLGEGTVNASDILPRLVVERAVRRGAASVIIAHNHPGGNTKPSDEDSAATNNLELILRTVGIVLREHYIVAGDTCVSVCESIKEDTRASFSR